MISCRQIVTSLSIFQFMANLEQSRSPFPDVWSVILLFLFIVTFYLTKTENRTKNSLTQLSYYWFYNMFFLWNKKYKRHQTNHCVAKINKCRAINCPSIYLLVYHLFQTDISVAHQVRCINWALHLRLHCFLRNLRISVIKVR